MKKISLLLAMTLFFAGQAAMAADGMMKNDKKDGTMKMQAPNGGMMHKDGGTMKPGAGMMKHKQMGKKKMHHMKHGHHMDKKSMKGSKHKGAMDKM